MSGNSILIKQINQFSVEQRPFLLIVDFELKKPLLYAIDELPDNILFQTPESHSNPGTGNKPSIQKFNRNHITFDRYQKAFRQIREEALAGNTYLANLTFPTTIGTNLGLREIYQIAEARYKLLFRDEFVVFSPETFVQIKGGKIYTCPMKGTIDASLPGAREFLLNDEKEMAEHVTIVDLLRNDLSKYATEVNVEKFRYVDTLVTNRKTLLQVSSLISGRLPDDYREKLGEILFSMLPAGSVSGAPKEKTLSIIREAEGIPRGYYTGIMGYFDGRDFDSAVLIRYIGRENDRLVYHSGGGITFMSDPKKEYNELIDKVYIPNS